MKEDFLHYLWKYKKLDLSNLKTTQNEEITILNSGQYLQKEGPDFFNAQLIIGEQKWAGNIEIHLKSSDWYVHQHEKDDEIEELAEARGMQKMRDGNGFHWYNTSYNAYFEILSYTKLLEDAKKRNRILFHKLNIPHS